MDTAAAAIFAGAVGFALWAGASGPAAATAAAAAAFLAAHFGLRRIAPTIQAYPLPAFPLGTIAPKDAQGEAAEELILEDKLAEISPDARVVRLFGPSQIHHPSNRLRPATPDASQALSEALAELRRALR